MSLLNPKDQGEAGESEPTGVNLNELKEDK